MANALVMKSGHHPRAMSQLDHLIRDIDGCIERGSVQVRAQAVSRIADLMVQGGDALTREQIALFDEVIQRFSVVIETRARIDLAQKLCGLPKGPRLTLLGLAGDQEVIVARPVLAGSDLADQDLVRIATERGRDHMLAICERASVSEMVTDVLVTLGDGVVRHAIAGNPGARFSAVGTAALLDHSRADDALQDLLGERDDLSPVQMRQLVEIAKQSARRRIGGSLTSGSRDAVASATDRSATSVVADLDRSVTDYGPALKVVRAITDVRALEEGDLSGFASDGRKEETICALAAMSGLSIGGVERVFQERDNDLLIVIGRARGWMWATVRSLLKLRDPALQEHHHFRRAEETFGTMAAPMAQRVLHFLRVREIAVKPVPSQRGLKLR